MSDTDSPIATNATSNTKVSRGKPMHSKNIAVHRSFSKTGATIPSEDERIARAYLKSARSANTKAFNKAMRASELVAKCVEMLATAQQNETDKIFNELFPTPTDTETVEIPNGGGLTSTVEDTTEPTMVVAIVSELAVYSSSEAEDSDLEEISDETDSTVMTPRLNETMVDFGEEVCTETAVDAVMEMQAV
jgi:hypothetical protein